MLLITLSGLDGCGKSTHVTGLTEHLRAKGLDVAILESAHVSIGGALGRFRNAWLGREPSRGRRRPATPPEAQEHRSRTANGKLKLHLKGWLIYPIDGLILRARIRTLRLHGHNAIVCDRYVYDKIVNLPKPNCLLTRLLLRIFPRPDVAFFLDARPQTVRRRRAEHPREYYTSRYGKYHQLARLTSALKTVPSTTIDETQLQLNKAVDAWLLSDE